MEKERRLIRLDVGDFLEIRSIEDTEKFYSGRTKDMTLMGICFSSEAEWRKGQVLLIDYFIPEELDSARLKMAVVWSEFIGPDKGYFCGGQIIDVEKEKQEKFANYYFKRLKERL